MQSSSRQVWDVAWPGSAHILLRKDKQMHTAALAYAIFGQGDGLLRRLKD